MNKLMIGIPIHNDLESLQAMIESLMTSTNAYDEIILLESESTDGCAEFCEHLSQIYQKIRVIHTKKEGPLKAYNKLFDIAKTGKYDLFLTQTDVLFPKLYKKDWLSIMRSIVQNEEVGAVTCINGGGISGPDYINGFEWLGGWATYFPYRTMEKIGGYDENFIGGWGVDIDYSYKIQLAKLKIIKINFWVHHHMQNNREHDNSSKSEEEKQKAAKYFRRKYKLGEFKIIKENTLEKNGR